MKTIQRGPQPSTLNSQPINAFTIVEMLVVIAIIAILAALLLPVLAGAQKAAKKKQAAMEISQIVGGIQQYDSVYGRFPVSGAAQSAAGAGDFTYGTLLTEADGISLWPPAPYPANYQTNNSEVIAILMDFTNYPGGGPTVNSNYVKNPQQTMFLNAKMSGWDPSQAGTPLPGVGNDLVYRDPWGTPYIISMDLNYDEKCSDVFYRSNTVSSPTKTNPGINGLISPDPVIGDNYQYHGKVMVWSAGPDKRVEPTSPANQGANKDNILSWQ
jgi:prepilin-type N-terminal cleavage/methylation domain-containing protein